MKVYFQDLNMDAQEEVWREVGEYLKEEGLIDDEELIDEQVDDYINRHNFGVEFSMTK